MLMPDHNGGRLVNRQQPNGAFAKPGRPENTKELFQKK
jgi:hypothetical protein